MSATLSSCGFFAGATPFSTKETIRFTPQIWATDRVAKVQILVTDHEPGRIHHRHVVLVARRAYLGMGSVRALPGKAEHRWDRAGSRWMRTHKLPCGSATLALGETVTGQGKLQL